MPLVVTLKAPSISTLTQDLLGVKRGRLPRGGEGVGARTLQEGADQSLRFARSVGVPRPRR